MGNQSGESMEMMIGVAVKINAKEGCLEVVDLAQEGRVLSKHRHPCMAELAARRAVIARAEARLEEMKAEAASLETHCSTEHSGNEEPELEKFYSQLREMELRRAGANAPEAAGPSLDDVLKGDELGPRALMPESKVSC